MKHSRWNGDAISDATVDTVRKLAPGIPPMAVRDKLSQCNRCADQVAGRCKLAPTGDDFLPCSVVVLTNQWCPKRAPTPTPTPPVYREPPQAEPRTIDRIAVCTCYFNPERYRRIRENIRRFRDEMTRYDVDLFVVELAFDDDPFEVSDATLSIRGTRAQHKLWQKERLLNLLFAHVPDEYDAIGWFDGDILFQNWNWVDGLRETLGRYTWAQPYSGSWFTETDGSLTNLKRSMGWYLHHEPQYFLHFGKAHPGFAWVARADWLRAHGLCDTNITGGGDALMVKAATPQPLFIEQWLNPDWRAAVEEWADAARRAGGDCLGFVPGDVVHLYHGRRSNRKYRERWAYLTDHDYNPATDVETDPDNGLIRWTKFALTVKPRMVELVSGYFAERKEDE